MASIVNEEASGYARDYRNPKKIVYLHQGKQLLVIIRTRPKQYRHAADETHEFGIEIMANLFYYDSTLITFDATQTHFDEFVVPERLIDRRGNGGRIAVLPDRYHRL